MSLFKYMLPANPVFEVLVLQRKNNICGKRSSRVIPMTKAIE